jgi:hypothetical protein
VVRGVIRARPIGRTGAWIFNQPSGAAIFADTKLMRQSLGQVKNAFDVEGLGKQIDQMGFFNPIS